MASQELQSTPTVYPQIAKANTGTPLTSPSHATGSLESLSLTPPLPSEQVLSALQTSIASIQKYQPLFEKMPDYDWKLGAALSVQGFDKAQRKAVETFLDNVPQAKQKVGELLAAYQNLSELFSAGAISAEQVTKCLAPLNQEMANFLDKEGARPILDSMLGKSRMEKLSIMAELKDNADIFGLLINSPNRICSIAQEQLAAIQRVVSQNPA